MVASVLEVSSGCWRALSLTGRSWQRTEGNQKGETSCLLCRGVVGTGSGVLTCSLCNPACASDIAVKWCGESSDRKSTRLNSSTNAHLVCRLLLEKKNKIRGKSKEQKTLDKSIST